MVPHELTVKGGGISNHALHLSKHLIKLGHKITIVALSEKQENLQEKGINLHNVACYHLPAFPYPSLAGFTIPNNFLYIKKIISEIINQGLDVIHTHGHHYPLTWYTASIAHKLEIPCVLTLHGMEGLDHDNPFACFLENVFNRTILASMLKNISAIIGLTPKVTNYLKKYIPEKSKFFTIPNGIYLDHFQETLHSKLMYRRKYGLPLDKKIILFRGRFSQVKGILELLKAVKSISVEKSDVLFVFVGDGPLRNPIIMTAEEVSNQKMMIFNWTPYSDIHELYIASDIYVLPSKREALPITIIEAMASRLHIVTTPVGGIPDVLSHYPWKTYINGFSPNAIINALNQSISVINTKKNEKEITKYNNYIKHFEWTKIAKETEKVYSELL